MFRKRALESNKKAFLKYDKLIVDGQSYTFKPIEIAPGRQI
uniref:Leucine-rich repeat-containing protein n=1 Tax=Triatoma infestans TaxID=30076 RepID=A0A170W9R9_TRIIF